jgi:outer membrane protein
MCSSLHIFSLGFFLKYLVLLFLFLSLSANDKYSFRVALGQASTKDLGEILTFDSDIHPDDLGVLSIDGGYLLKESIYDLPLDLYVKGGLSYFGEADKHILGKGPLAVIYSGERSDVYEGTIYIKVYYNIDFWKNRIRVGLGEGVSYTSSVLWAEEKESAQENEDYSKFLNYLDISIDVDLGKLIKYKPLEETYIGWTLKHRSGVFGLYNGVDGGSNYNTISLEKNF